MTYILVGVGGQQKSIIATKCFHNLTGLIPTRMKKIQFRTTSGSSHVEKVHTVVA